MGLQRAQKIWKLAHDVSSNGPLAEWTKLNAGSVPFHLRHHRHIIPTLTHHKATVTFGSDITSNGNKVRRAFYPNILYRPLTSRALGMVVWCRVAAETLLEIDRKGGLDEYLMSVGSDKLTCPIAMMYRRKVVEAFRAARPELVHPTLEGGRVRAERERMLTLLGGKYGQEYQKKLEAVCDRQYKLKAFTTTE